MKRKKNQPLKEEEAIEKKVSDAKVSEAISAKSMGLAYLEENELENAEIQFKRLIELAPGDASGYANLGVVYLRAGKYDLAEDYLSEALGEKTG